MNKIVKRVIISTVVVALAGTGAAAGLLQLRKNNQKEVMVTSVKNLVSDYYMPTTSIEGSVTTSVSQNVSVDNDMIIQQVYVSEGDNVKKGDPLISFDTTLVEMELNIAKLKHKKLEQDLSRAINRLNSLLNGGPIIEGDIGGTADEPGDSGLPDEEGEDMASIKGMSNSGNYLATAFPPLLLAAISDAQLQEGDEETNDADYEKQNAIEEAVRPPEYIDPSAGDFTSGEDISDGEGDGGIHSGQDDVPPPTPTPTPVLDENTSYYDPYFIDEMDGITDGREKFYDKLDSKSEPFTGVGTKEDPLVFLVSSARGSVTAMGSFFNKMAGYSEDGTRVEKEGGYWFQLEFHQNDTIGDYQDRKLSCTGYYLINGSFLSQPVYEYVESEFTLSEAMTYEPEEPEEPDYPGGGGSGNTEMSRAEAIKYQKRKIAILKLDIQESNIKLGKLEKKVNKKLISSKLDGIVTYVGDVVTKESDGSAFIKVKSGDGYYVIGAVNELMRDQLEEGTILSCMSYDKGEFEAEVMEVSEFPISGTMYPGNNNPNASYYSFTAEVLDKSIKFADYDYITINMESSKSIKGSLVLQKAFVRSENGKSYVYKDENGVLKKQYLTVGGNVDGGYSVLVKGGITENDLIAFPYGKAVVEGAKTKEVTMEQMYGY